MGVLAPTVDGLFRSTDTATQCCCCTTELMLILLRCDSYFDDYLGIYISDDHDVPLHLCKISIPHCTICAYEASRLLSMVLIITVRAAVRRVILDGLPMSSSSIWQL